MKLAIATIALALALPTIVSHKRCNFPKPPDPPTPSPSSTPTPIPSATPSITPSPTPTALPSPSPSIEPSPQPTPTPSPTPPPTGNTTVDRIILLVVVGSPCKIPGTQFVWETGCKEAFVTATPKQDDGEDAVHGRNLRWFLGENCVTDDGVNEGAACVELTDVIERDRIEIFDIWSQGVETLFNKWFHPVEQGKEKLWVALQEPPTVKHPTGFFWQMREIKVCNNPYATKPPSCK